MRREWWAPEIELKGKTPHERGLEMEAKAAAGPTPNLRAKEAEPPTYCYRCGDPVIGGLHVAGRRVGRRRIAYVIAFDHDHFCLTG